MSILIDYFSLIFSLIYLLIHFLVTNCVRNGYNTMVRPISKVNGLTNIYMELKLLQIDLV
jgi:hypothetical protein